MEWALAMGLVRGALARFSRVSNGSSAPFLSDRVTTRTVVERAEFAMLSGIGFSLVRLGDGAGQTTTSPTNLPQFSTPGLGGATFPTLKWE
jgi:hypothetical protein